MEAGRDQFEELDCRKLAGHIGTCQVAAQRSTFVTLMSVSAPQLSSSGSRSRPQARRKLNDDASYFGPTGTSSGTGVKRNAADKVDGEPRGKRKRVEPINTTSPANTRKEGGEAESKTSLVCGLNCALTLHPGSKRPMYSRLKTLSKQVEFIKMPTPVLYKYLVQFDIVPHVYPSPMTAEDPAPPSTLEYSARQSPLEPSTPLITPANRPRRDPKEQNRRRSSRLLEEARSRTPILADIDELHTVLAGIVEKHFREMPPISGREEVDTLASFMCAVEKAKGGRVKC